MDLNCVSLIGNLTRDPELTSTTTGKLKVNFSIAVNGYKQDDVSFFNCEAWGATAEFISKYITKGNKVGVKGRLQQQRWQKDNKNFQRVVVVVEQVQSLSKKKDNGVPY